MTAFAGGAFAPAPLADDSSLTRAERVALSAPFERPTLVLDLEAVAETHGALAAGLGRAELYYAVKANPHPALIERLIALGARFDCASRGELALCLSLGAAPGRLSYGNTIKRAADIAWAHGAGVGLFAADADEELEKIAANAPGAQVYVRVLVDNPEADWPLSRKFGCAPETALRLLRRARGLGLAPVGLSFHVGSQTREARFWAPTLAFVGGIWAQAQAEARAAGCPLDLINIGGGFPASYEAAVAAPGDYAAEVMAMVEAHFPDAARVMAEPGRGLAAAAGALACEVMLVARKSESDLHRWVYLSAGRFSGLAETEGEAIRYPFLTHRAAEPTGPCIVAGPSCDSADVLYERRPVHLPLGLASGDRVVLRGAGAYTTSYASVGFNGFPPLDVLVI